MELAFLNGWQVTPDTLISLWLALSLTKVSHNHDKRISLLERRGDGDL